MIYKPIFTFLLEIRFWYLLFWFFKYVWKQLCLCIQFLAIQQQPGGRKECWVNTWSLKQKLKVNEAAEVMQREQPGGRKECWINTWSLKQKLKVNEAAEVMRSKAGTLFTNLVWMKNWVSFGGKEGYINAHIRSIYSIYPPRKDGKPCQLWWKRMLHKCSNQKLLLYLPTS